jgi:hypothetical protein
LFPALDAQDRFYVIVARGNIFVWLACTLGFDLLHPRAQSL